MRKIIFRAKRKPDGKWVKGDLTHVAVICSPEEVEKDGKRTNNVLRVANYDIEEETLGQYTGMKDNNGKEIWEGDILSYNHSRQSPCYPVEFVDGAFCIAIAGNIALKNCEVSKYMLVKGNIFDNKELLKKTTSNGND